eukprot:TRINITY_DN7961_c0_g1_i1.p1 TRINITY_DN7961_c0_g1~~TRINITY_DN7961_c0_g1_i1.p1  ORF type:complete len:666 (+),score=192.69 TRINITY_DN7961_c0_g1_i1:79-2076(+)
MASRCGEIMAAAGQCVLGAAMCVLGPVFDKLFVSEDDGDMKARKVVCFMFSATCLAMIVLQMAWTGAARGFSSDGDELFWVWTTWAAAQDVGFIIYMFATKRAGDGFFAVVVFSAFLPLVLFDLHQASAMQARVGPIFVVVVDMMLVGHLPEAVSFVFVALTVLWLVVMEMELMNRFGLLDVWGTATPEQRRAAMCDCDVPPCGVSMGAAMRGSQIGCFVFILDFFITRRFANAVEEEKGRMRAAITTAKHVAGALAGFDLAAAEGALAMQGDVLPAELLVSYQRLVANLGSYKPYLPQSCLPMDDGDTGTDSSDGGSELSVARSSHSVASAGQRRPSRTQSQRSCSSSHRSTSRRSSLSSRGAVPKKAPVGAVRTNFLKQTKMTLLNITAHLPPPDPPRLYAELHELFIGRVLMCVAQARGVVDSFLASSVTASFNAARPAVTHAKNALKCVEALVGTVCEAGLTGSVATGIAAVGVLGTDTMRRQTVVGPLPALAAHLERFGAAAGCGWVCNRLAFVDCWMEVALRVVLDTMAGDGFAKGYEDWRNVAAAAQDTIAYEVMAASKARDDKGAGSATINVPAGADEPDEWMYELEKGVGKVWEAYNEAGYVYLMTHDAARAAEKLAAHDEHRCLFEERLRGGRVLRMDPCAEPRACVESASEDLA